MFIFYLFDLVASIIKFNQTNFVNLSLPYTITNLSLFFNTLQPNGTLFRLNSFVGGLINGYFRLISLTNRSSQYELRSQEKINDGQTHRIDFELDQSRLIIDESYNETIDRSERDFYSNEIELFPDRFFNGWYQDLRVNDQLITLHNQSKRSTNPCFPTNPCLNQGRCLVTNSLDYM